MGQVVMCQAGMFSEQSRCQGEAHCRAVHCSGGGAPPQSSGGVIRLLGSITVEGLKRPQWV
jgi:hypothetical protein